MANASLQLLFNRQGYTQDAVHHHRHHHYHYAACAAKATVDTILVFAREMAWWELE
jgi:hypothetical protein